MFWMALVLCGSANPGDSDANAVERVDDVRDLADDRRDRAALTAAIDQWEAARSAGDAAGERAADETIGRWIARELAENRRDIAEARRELGDSDRERRGSRREVRQTRGRGTPIKAADSRRDLRGDRRDQADDARDLAVTRADAARTREIAGSLKAMQPRFDSGTASSGDYASKSRLLAELRTLAHAEVRQDRVERAEDRVERAEDRRERWERR